MPDNTQTIRIRQLIKTARHSIDTLSSALEEIETALADLDQENNVLDYGALSSPGPETTFTQEEAEIMLLKMLLNVNEAAFFLGVKTDEVYRMISAKELPFLKIGRAVRIPVKQLREHIEAIRGGEG